MGTATINASPGWPAAFDRFAPFKGMPVLAMFSGLVAPVRRLVIASGLVVLPWWGSDCPRVVAYFNPEFARVVHDMLDDSERTTHFVDSTPEDSSLHDGRRLTWDASSGPYAEVFKAFELARPVPAPSDPDAALAMLASTIASQVATFDDNAKAALHSRLQRDIDSDLDHAAVAFLAATRETVLTRARDERAVRAAYGFIEAWVGKQHLHAHDQLARTERDQLDKDVADLR